MRLMTVVVGASCLLLMALFIALFAIAHNASAADVPSVEHTVKMVQAR